MQPIGTNPFAQFPIPNQYKEPFDLYNFIEGLSEESEENIQMVLKDFLNEENLNLASQAIIKLFESLLPTENQTEVLNLFIQHFPHEHLRPFIQLLVSAVTPRTAAKIFTLIEDRSMAEIFSLEFIDYNLHEYRQIPITDEEIDEIIEDLEVFIEDGEFPPFKVNENLSNVFQCFIEGVSETIDFEHPKAPLVLKIFLEQLEKLDLIHHSVCERFEEFEEFEQLCILLCFSPLSFNAFVENFDAEANPYKLPTLLDKLFSLENVYEKKVAITRKFFNALPTHAFCNFILAITELNSPCIPYICLALCDNDLCDLCWEFDEKASSNLLRKSLPKLCSVTQWILNDLEKKNRITVLCEHAELDIVSQNYIIDNGVAWAPQLTLQEACLYINAHQGELEDFMETFQDDLNRIPPFLLAIGMRVPEYRQAILSVRIFLSDEQLIGVVRSLKKEDYKKTLETLLSNIRADQMHIIIQNLYFKFFDLYLENLTTILSKKMESINEFHGELKLKFQEKPATEEEYLQLQEETFSQLGRLKAILTPLNHQINARCRYVKKALSFSDIISACKVFLSDLEGPGGFYERLQDWEAEKEIETTDFLKTLQLQDDMTIKDLAHYGIYYDVDCELLDFEIKEYLAQDKLKEIWIFLKKKHLTSIQALFEFCCVEGKEDLMNLEEVAKKLGFVLKIN